MTKNNLLSLALSTAFLTGCQNEFTVTTYNIAALPQGISASNPEKNVPLISKKLGELSRNEEKEIILVQEDFSYHQELTKNTGYPYKTEPPEEYESLGDGLNAFSDFEITNHIRQGWRNCNGHFEDGSDCLTPKGFSVAEYEVVSGVKIDMYNLHMDSGDSLEDEDARKLQTEQFIETFNFRSQGKAAIVAGDYNTSGYLLFRLKSATGLTDSCDVLACSDPNSIDRILFKNNEYVTLTPLEHRVDSGFFVDENGEPLSDHLPVSVKFKIVAGPPGKELFVKNTEE